MQEQSILPQDEKSPAEMQAHSCRAGYLKSGVASSQRASRCAATFTLSGLLLRTSSTTASTCETHGNLSIVLAHQQLVRVLTGWASTFAVHGSVLRTSSTIASTCETHECLSIELAHQQLVQLLTAWPPSPCPALSTFRTSSNSSSICAAQT